jgi:hypothetical protein
MATQSHRNENGRSTASRDTQSDQLGLVDTPTQLDVQGPGGSTMRTWVTLYNASSATERVDRGPGPRARPVMWAGRPTGIARISGVVGRTAPAARHRADLTFGL